MLLPDNIPSILEAAWNEPAILICYKAFTQKERRTNEYFASSETNPKQFVEFILSNLCGAPLFISEHQSNVYLNL